VVEKARKTSALLLRKGILVEIFVMSWMPPPSYNAAMKSLKSLTTFRS
jgi:hypothetical protein